MHLIVKSEGDDDAKGRRSSRMEESTSSGSSSSPEALLLQGADVEFGSTRIEHQTIAPAPAIAMAPIAITYVSGKAKRTVSMPSRKMFIPKTSSDWESVKLVIEELYMTQNKTLKEVIQTMEADYGFKATARMYKRQLARWHLYKYSPMRRAQQTTVTGSTSSTDAATFVRSQTPNPRHPDLIKVRSSFCRLPHENDCSRYMETGLSAVQHFVRGSADLDPSWDVLGQVICSIDDPFYKYFKAAINLFDVGENDLGGQVMRYSFLMAERRLSANSRKAFSELCFFIPHLLLAYGRPHILRIYLRYLSHLARIRYGDHPITRTISASERLLQEPGGAGAFMHYITVMGKINADPVTDFRGAYDRTRLWTCMACATIGDPTVYQKHVLEHEQLQREATSTLGPKHVLCSVIEAETLICQWIHQSWGPDFIPRWEALMQDLPEEEAQKVVGMYTFLQVDYNEFIGDLDKSIEWGRKVVELTDGDRTEAYIISNVKMEQLLRRAGRDTEADEMRAERQDSRWMDNISREVSRLAIQGPESESE